MSDIESSMQALNDIPRHSVTAEDLSAADMQDLKAGSSGFRCRSSIKSHEIPRLDADPRSTLQIECAFSYLIQRMRRSRRALGPPWNGSKADLPGS